MNDILTYTVIFFGYLFVVWLIHDQLFSYLEDFKKFVNDSIDDLTNETKNFSNNGYNSYLNIINKPNDENFSKHRRTFIFISVVSILLISQNIVALTRVLETTPTLNQPIIDNVGLLSNLTWGAFMALGIVITEFIIGWTLFQKQEVQYEDGPKNTLNTWLGTLIVLCAFIVIFTESQIWYQISDSVTSNEDFVNIFSGSLFDSFGATFIAILGGGVTVLEIALGYYAARAQSKFQGFNVAQSLNNIGNHLQSFLFYTLSLLTYILTLFLKLIPFLVNFSTKILELLSLPALFLYKRFKK